MLRDKCLILGLVTIVLSACGDNTLPVGDASQKLNLPLLHTQTPLQHEFWIQPQLATGQITITDTITLSAPTAPSALEFTLGKGFTLSIDQATVNPVQTLAQTAVYRVPIAAEQTTLKLQYSAHLDSTSDCEWLTQTCRRLTTAGIYLDQGSFWYPETQSGLHTFKLKLDTPPQWSSISQGSWMNDQWQETQPQPSIYLIAAPFKRYTQTTKGIETSVYLLNDDPTLAERYLKATQTYIPRYAEQLGPYPYSKFATVESFWETGWGMPSFTLLGPQVMRLPFIVDSSFPHEIMHNWWGNGVYVDAHLGNWSEGLTAYLADHAQKLAKGEDAAYRRDLLQKFTTFVTTEHDQALSQFQTRHDQSTQAIGYGKSLMLFHMLHQKLGDALFFKSLQQFYSQYRFKRASFADLEHTFSQVTQQDLSAFFTQWRDRTGAPQLKLLNAKPLSSQQVEFTLQQTQAEPVFNLTIPVILNYGQDKPERQTITMTEREQRFTLNTTQVIKSLAIDPYFDVMRRPQVQELPAVLDALSQTQPMPKIVVLPRHASPAMQAEWQTLAQQWSTPTQTIQLFYDDQPLPKAGTMILLGGENAALSELATQAQQPQLVSELSAKLFQDNYSCGLHTMAFALRLGQQTVVSLAADNPDALQRLMKKLPHYGSYSYVLFDGTTGANLIKEQWDVVDSPLQITLPEIK